MSYRVFTPSALAPSGEELSVALQQHGPVAWPNSDDDEGDEGEGPQQQEERKPASSAASYSHRRPRRRVHRTSQSDGRTRHSSTSSVGSVNSVGSNRTQDDGFEPFDFDDLVEREPRGVHNGGVGKYAINGIKNIDMEWRTVQGKKKPSKDSPESENSDQAKQTIVGLPSETSNLKLEIPYPIESFSKLSLVSPVKEPSPPPQNKTSPKFNGTKHDFPSLSDSLTKTPKSLSANPTPKTPSMSTGTPKAQTMNIPPKTPSSSSATPPPKPREKRLTYKKISLDGTPIDEQLAKGAPKEPSPTKEPRAPAWGLPQDKAASPMANIMKTQVGE